MDSYPNENRHLELAALPAQAGQVANSRIAITIPLVAKELARRIEEARACRVTFSPEVA